MPVADLLIVERDRMQMRKLVAAAITTMVATTALADGIYDTTGQFSGSYLCEADASGGVAYDENLHQWVATTFRTDKNRLTVVVGQQSMGKASFLSKDELAMVYTISVGSFGEKSQACSAIGGFTPVNSGGSALVMYSSGFVSCDAAFMTYKFNFDKLRYMRIYSFGFVDGEDKGGNTPLVEIGKCGKIN